MLRLQTSQLRMRETKYEKKERKVDDGRVCYFPSSIIIRMSFTKGPESRTRTRYLRYYHTSEKKACGPRGKVHEISLENKLPRSPRTANRDRSPKISKAARLQSKGSQDQTEEASTGGTKLDVGSGTGGLNGTTGGTGGRAAGAAGALVGCRKGKRVSGRAPGLGSCEKGGTYS